MVYRNLSVIYVIIVLILLGNFDRAYGIPAFARKYNKSCQTCHVSEPKLNAFGERFRANGYQLPGTIEDTPPWSLKKVPIAGMLHEMFITREIRNDMNGATPPPGLPPGKTYDVRSFRDMGGHIWMGGTLGRKLSFFTSIGIEQELDVEDGRFGSPTDAHWEQAFFQYNNIFNSGSGAANIKFGHFELELPFSNIRRMSSELAQYEVYNIRGVKGSFKLSAPQVGVSLNGLKHFGVNSLRYEIAYVNGTNGNFDTNTEFDYYTRLALWRLSDGFIKNLRVGGMYYSGTQNLRDLPGNPFPTAAVLDYWKDEHKINVHINPDNASFYRWGLDLSIDLNLIGKPINLYGQYLVGHDDDIDMTNLNMPFLSGESAGEGGGGHAKIASTHAQWLVRPFDYNGGFIGADIVIIPTKFYLISRFDWVNVENQWGDPVDGVYVRDNGSATWEYNGGIRDNGDPMPRDMTGKKVIGGNSIPENKITRYSIGFRWHLLQPATLVFEYSRQDNLFGFPEPPPFMYNPDWVAGMGRVVSVDSDWFMFMMMFAF